MSSDEDRSKDSLDARGAKLFGQAANGEDETIAAGSGSRANPNHPVIEGYEIVRELSRGGQGVVYQGIQTGTKRKVAIKILLAGEHASESSRRRFEREIELVAQLKHPNIITIFQSGTTPDGRQFAVMDYVRGVPLTDYVREKKPTLEEALELLATVCDAVQYAHQKGVIHRDLKPSNILVDADGQPKVLDFGLAKQLLMTTDTMLTISDQVVGTLPYMSPEQARGNPDEIDTRTDVYALGVIGYLMLTGKHPYPVVGAMADILRHIAETEPTPPSRAWTSDSGVSQRATWRKLRVGSCPIDDEVQTVLLKALSKECERRYQRAMDLARDLRHYLADEPIEAKRDSLLYRVRKAAVRRWRSFATTAAVAALMIVVAMLASSNRSSRQLLADIAECEVRLPHARTDPAALAELVDRLTGLIEIDPAQPRALYARGAAYAASGLHAPIDRKRRFAELAIADFEAAHVAAGGLPFATKADAASDERQGLPVGVWSASKLWSQLGESESARALAERAALWQPATITEAPLPAARVYGLEDDLLRKRARDLALTPNLAGKDPDTGARITLVFKDPFQGVVLATNRAPYPYLAELVFDTLFVVNAQMEAVYNPALIENAYRDDSGTWQMVLRDGITWHDNERLTTSDVELSWRFWLGSNSNWRLSVLDERTFDLIPNSATANDFELRFHVLPQHVVSPYNDATSLLRALQLNPIGSGPFRVIDGTPENRLHVQRFDQYAGDRPRIAEIVCQAGLSHSDRLLELANGDTDVMELTPDEFRWGVNGESFRQVIKMCEKRRAYDYICWNIARRDSLFARPDVRRALAHAVDADAIREHEFDGLFDPFAGIFGRGTVSGLQFDRVLSADLLDQAGWEFPANAGKVRTKDGRPFRFTLLVAEESASAYRVAVRLQQDWSRVGIEATVNAVPLREMMERATRGDFDAFYGSVVTSPNLARDAPRWITTQGRPNYGGYSNARVSNLFEEAFEAQAVQSIGLRDQKFREIEQRIFEDQPYLFLWQRPALWAINRRLYGVEFSEVGPVGFYPGPRNWWVAAGAD